MGEEPSSAEMFSNHTLTTQSTDSDEDIFPFHSFSTPEVTWLDEEMAEDVDRRSKQSLELRPTQSDSTVTANVW
ncbi:hypothetical protein BLNAU_5187 [Blattamonas nauphoetae]|uniref:Uncharacterized protein n=1 Tax=Blattamonas nauphoetae TaxID=2049346 RepID=A0ABQ9Y7F4_9EUKA|nr:hypothetical protein BLNAU_5184 [Blattamonas nauphoetae]KAK2959698.1 hypothetical protein BLNAU_5187 [Blattamonas nauphoetae]